MEKDTFESYSALEQAQKRPYLHRLMREKIFALLSNMDQAQLDWWDGQEKFVFGQTSARFPEPIQVQVVDSDFYLSLALNGSMGAGESYMAGQWHCSDLPQLIAALLAHRSIINQMDSWSSWLKKPIWATHQWLRRNSHIGAKRNIHDHYDLGNNFFGLFLDKNRMYSCARFADPEMNLDQASLGKLETICRKLDLKPSDHLVEIGSGWGGLAIYAAKTRGCRVTTTTISQEQFDYAQVWIQREGLQDRITLLQKDYRELTGQFDKLVSVEMIEAVGHRYLKTFMAQCSRLLKPEGRMLLQAITIRDQNYFRALKEVDFIKKHIFPGSFIPSTSIILDAMRRATDLTLSHLEDWSDAYHRTLLAWRKRFLSAKSDLDRLGYDSVFQRKWDFYFSYCAGAYQERAIGLVQMLLTKPNCTRTGLNLEVQP
ncbi:MAG: class I SAM-dependent methyltransferase [Acidobacteria bacterium]|nr:class I SAM-dependent methyltransferase [Acidobacteriota bacterium]